jgi:hypothetical protein
VGAEYAGLQVERTVPTVQQVWMAIQAIRQNRQLRPGERQHGVDALAVHTRQEELRALLQHRQAGRNLARLVIVLAGRFKVFLERHDLAGGLLEVALDRNAGRLLGPPRVVHPPTTPVPSQPFFPGPAVQQTALVAPPHALGVPGVVEQIQGGRFVFDRHHVLALSAIAAGGLALLDQLRAVAGVVAVRAEEVTIQPAPGRPLAVLARCG